MTDQPPPARTSFNAEAASMGMGDRREAVYPETREPSGIKMLETELHVPSDLRKPTALKAPSDSAALLHAMIGTADREHFVAFYLNSKHQITHVHLVSRGTVQSALVHPREVFKGAVLSNAAAVIVGHNHPSGGVTPSGEDLEVFERLKRAGEVLGIKVLDSLIVGPSRRFYSSLHGMSEELPLRSLERAEELCADESAGSFYIREARLKMICDGLLQDIDEVLERQGEKWWDETVTSGIHHRARAEEILGRVQFEPMGDEAENGLDLV